MRTTLLATVLFVPVLASAFTGGWESLPTNWLPAELTWALPIAPAGTTAAELLENVDSPPRAAWCGPQGAWRQATVVECDAYDLALDAWVVDLQEGSNQIPAYNYPPTYCGGC